MNLIQLLANTGDIEGDINALSIQTVLIASLLLITLLLISTRVVKKRKYKKYKKPLFILIVLTIALPSFLLMGSTVYVNTISDSKGPVHWHTDIEFWVCDQEIELRDPTGLLSNKIGTSTYHEHDDKRIHLEGVVIEKAYDASLDKFMSVTGGEISDTSLTIATNDSTVLEDDLDGDSALNDEILLEDFIKTDSEGNKVIQVSNGESCGNGESAEVQAFLFRYDKANKTYTQTKLQDPKAYVMRDESVVPPGDCLIVEFNKPMTRTDRLCQQYGVKDRDRCVEFGVTSFNPKICDMYEVTNTETQGGAQ